MNDIYVTLTGNVAAEPRQYSFDEGVRVTSLRVLTSHRYFDKKTGQWADGEKVCFTVRCWRALGENVAASVRAGHPVVVSGKLRIREFGAEGDRRFMPEIEASAVGHDLRWGTGAFTKPERGGGVGSMSREMRDRLDEETRDWAMGPRPQRSLGRPELRDESTLHPFATDPDPMRPLGLDESTVRPLNSDDGAVRTLGPDGAVRTLTSGDGARTSGPEEEAVGALGPEAGTVRTSGMDEDAVRALGSDEGAVRTLGSDEGAIRSLGSGDGAVRTSGSEGGAIRTSGARDGAVRGSGSRDGARRTLGSGAGAVRTFRSGDDTVRILGAEDDGKGREAGADEEGGDGEQPRMEERAAA